MNEYFVTINIQGKLTEEILRRIKDSTHFESISSSDSYLGSETIVTYKVATFAIDAAINITVGLVRLAIDKYDVVFHQVIATRR